MEINKETDGNRQRQAGRQRERWEIESVMRESQKVSQR